MPYINKVEFMGNLAKDPELRYMPDGTATTKITIAVVEKWTDKSNGEIKEHIEWIPVLLYKRQAEVVCQYMKKGDTILVYGKQRSRRFVDSNGNERQITEVIAAEMQIIRTRGQQGEQAEQNLSDGIYGMM